MLKFDLKIDSKLECGDDHKTMTNRFAARATCASSDFFWVQETSQRGHAKVLPVRRENNPADLFTKDSAREIQGAVPESAGFRQESTCTARHGCRMCRSLNKHDSMQQ